MAEHSTNKPFGFESYFSRLIIVLVLKDVFLLSFLSIVSFVCDRVSQCVTYPGFKLSICLIV